MDQRLVGLSYTTGAGLLNVTTPPNGSIAPPGYYMLFLLNSAGVPSFARFVQLSATIPNQPPTATITNPAGNVTIYPGQSVSFAGTGSDSDGSITAYSWTFPGGNPNSSSVANPGNVTYSAAGIYTASFTVTDSGGAKSQPATRTVTVADFSLSATPASRSILAGASTTYTATVTAGAGFTGTVTFNLAGLPAGATASFNPTSINPSGSTTLSVATAGSTPAGSYPLTITGTSGPVTHSVNVTLVITGDFMISATPASVTTNRGGTATYTVTITAVGGFTGTVTLSQSLQPRQANIRFTSASVVNSGNSTLTIDTKNNMPLGTNVVTITGTSGGQSHSTTVNLVLQ